ncbi:MAG: hypothetical protein ACRC5M_04405 [Anaeroplasmataceae bacterium]
MRRYRCPTCGSNISIYERIRNRCDYLMDLLPYRDQDTITRHIIRRDLNVYDALDLIESCVDIHRHKIIGKLYYDFDDFMEYEMYGDFY